VKRGRRPQQATALSVWQRRRTLVLGVVAAAAVAAAVAVTVFGHSPGESKQRRLVSSYVAAVNGIEHDMHVPLSRVMLAYRDFTGQTGTKRDSAGELAAAVATLDRLDRRLASVPAPPEAAKLRRRILALVAAQARITREVQRLAVFAPRFAAALARAHAANAVLSAALRSVDVPRAHALRGTRAKVRKAQRAYQARAQRAADAQATAISAYTDVLGGVLGQLRTLQPPDVLRPSYDTQLVALRSIRSSGNRLAAQLRQPNRARVAVLGRRFALASRIAQSTAAQRAEIAAVERYNARARAVAQFAALVQSELQRLQRDLP
jgi:hypothetical protein